MKKILITSALALLIFASCEKDDQTGIPPVTGNEKPAPSTLPTIEAATSDVSVYEVGKTVKMHGNITIQSGFAYFKLKDNTLIQIYAPRAVTDNLSQEAKTKLATEGQEVTVTGKFTDYKRASGEVVKEIVYSQESDLVFGSTPNVTIQEIEAATSDVSVYEVGKTVKMHGNITIQNGRSYFKLKDNTLIQIFAHKSVTDNLSQEAKTKLATEGQEVTVTGKFTDYKLASGEVIKEIVYSQESDLVFGTTPNVTPVTPVDIEAKTTNLADVFEINKLVKVHGFITMENNRSWISFQDGQKVQLYILGYTSLSQATKDKLNTEGQEVTVTGKFGEYNNIKQIQIEKEADIVFGTTPPTPTPSVPVDIEAKTTNLADVFEINKLVKVHGLITIENNRSWISFQDGQKVQLYISGYNSLSQATKDKLNTEGQEVTVTGKFGEYSGTKQIQIEKEADIVFGTTPPTPTPSVPVDIDAKTTNLSDVFEINKLVKVHGLITIENNRSWISFKDNQKVQLYISGYNSLPQATKDKLNTEGQEVTVTGKFGEYSGTKQIQIEKEADIVFGTTPSPNPNPNPTAKKFDFEDLTSSSTSYTATGELTASDGTKLEYKARTNLVDSNINYGIEGSKGLMLRKAADNGYVKLSFASNVTKVTFQAKGAFKGKGQRIITIVEGDENSDKEIDKKSFNYNGETDTTVHTFTINVSNNVITFKLGTAASTTAQVVIDNISWE